MTATTNPDSINKIINIYFACVTNKPIAYKSKILEPKPLRVSPLLLRDFTCPIMCGGCCPKFTLDYIQGEEYPDTVQKRIITLNNKEYEVYSDLQNDNYNPDKKCKNLNRDDGRCGIYLKRPFSCDFELIRFMQSQNEKNDQNQLTQKLFGRGWNMMRIDGNRGALCEMTPITEKSIAEVIRKLKRLEMWLTHFEIHDNKLNRIFEWISDIQEKNIPYDKIQPLFINKDGMVNQKQTVENFYE